MVFTKENNKFVNAHIVGSPNPQSNHEKQIYRNIQRMLFHNPDCKYIFYINQDLTSLGVDTDGFNISNYKDEFIVFAQQRCGASFQEAAQLCASVGNEDMDTNSMKLDFGKGLNGKLVVAMEVNDEAHYTIPTNKEDYKKFARVLFSDLIKSKILSSIAEYFEADMTISNNYGVGSREDLDLRTKVNQFIYD